MRKNSKNKEEALEKLHNILDNPYSKKVKDDEDLKKLSRRIKQSSKKNIVYIHSSIKKNQEEDSLEPTVVVHRKERKIEPEVIPEFKLAEEKPTKITKPTETVEPSELKEQKEVVFKEIETKETEDKDLFEIEKVESREPEFLEVKPKLSLKKEKDAEELPEWKPVEIKKSDIKEEPIIVSPTPLLPVDESSIKKSENDTVEKTEYTPEPEEEVSEEEKERLLEQERQQKIKIFSDIKSIDDDTAVLLYDGGYTSVESLYDATLKDIMKNSKVKKRLAKKIKKEIDQIHKSSIELTSEKKTVETGKKKKNDFNEETEVTMAEDSIMQVESDEEMQKKIDVFKGIESIDNKTALLLYKNGITSIDILREKKIKDLTKIRGIRRKLAKKIKKELNKKKKNIDLQNVDATGNEVSKTVENVDEYGLFIDKDAEEWEVVEEDLVSKPKKSKKKKDRVYSYGDYKLYKKEIQIKTGKTRTIYFFSREKPDDGKQVPFPEGYEVKLNKKTGVPYLKKIKK